MFVTAWNYVLSIDSDNTNTVTVTMVSSTESLNFEGNNNYI